MAEKGKRRPALEGVASADRALTVLSAFRKGDRSLSLAELAERTGYARSILMNSGAEAVETAIKLARKWGHVVRGVPDGAQKIVVFSGNFHGRTTTLVSFSDSAAYRDGSLSPEEVANRLLEAVQASDTQQPPLRAVTQMQREEVLRRGSPHRKPDISIVRKGLHERPVPVVGRVGEERPVSPVHVRREPVRAGDEPRRNPRGHGRVHLELHRDLGAG